MRSALRAGSLLDFLLRRGLRAENDDTVNEQHVLLAGLDIASALLTMEQCSVSHNDLKPANVLFVFSKRSLDGLREYLLKLCDFGFASLFAENKEHASIWLGTLHYMAPERQVPPGRTSTAGDVYAFGVTMLEVWNSCMTSNFCNLDILLARNALQHVPARRTA